MNALRTSINQYVSSTRPKFIDSAVASINRWGQETTTIGDSRQRNYLATHTIDLDKIVGLRKDVFLTLVGLHPQNCHALASADFEQAESILNTDLTEDEFAIIDKLSEEDLRSFTEMPRTLAESVDPGAEKTEHDLYFTLVFSAFNLHDVLVDLLYEEYQNNPAGRAHPSFPNMYPQKNPPRENPIIFLRIPRKYVIDSRYACMEYSLVEGGRKADRSVIQIQLADQNQCTIPPVFKEEGHVWMETMGGLMTITKRSDLGFTMRMDVIGNPDIAVVPDGFIAKALSETYIQAVRDGILGSVERTIRRECLEAELNTSETLCRTQLPTRRTQL